MPEWYQVFDAQGAEVALVLAYTKQGTIRSARLNGYGGATSAQRLNAYDGGN